MPLSILISLSYYLTIEHCSWMDSLKNSIAYDTNRRCSPEFICLGFKKLDLRIDRYDLARGRPQISGTPILIDLNYDITSIYNSLILPLYSDNILRSMRIISVT